MRYPISDFIVKKDPIFSDGRRWEFIACMECKGHGRVIVRCDHIPETGFLGRGLVQVCNGWREAVEVTAKYLGINAFS